MNAQKRMEELIDILNKANYEYYVLANPTIEDMEYDRDTPPSYYGWRQQSMFDESR